MGFRSKLWSVFKKHKILFSIIFIIITLWLEFNVFNFPFLSISQKSILLFLLFQLNLIFILVLLYLIFRYLFKIFWEIKIKRISKSIKIKLFATYFISIIFPSLLLVLGSFFFFKKTIDYWINEFLEEKVISKFMKVEDYYKDVERKLFVKGQEIIKDYISKTERIKSKVLRERYRYFSDLDSIEVYTYSGERYKRTRSSKVPKKLGIPPSVLEKIKNEKAPTTQISRISSGVLVRVFIPCKDKYGRDFILAVGKVLEPQKLIEIETLPEKKYFKTFKNFLLMAGISILLLIIFVGIWVGSKIGRNLTEPLYNLISATQKISQKDYSLGELTSQKISEDEIGVLIQSFKEMVEKIKKYEEDMEKYNKYLLSILNHLPVGILILNRDLEIKYFNENLKSFLANYEFKDVKEFLNHLNIFEFIRSLELTTPFYKVFEFLKGDKEIFLGVSILKLELFKEESYMLILENLEEKEIIKRLSIWKEVAMRVAHEIKNPLTPIKLSVERLKIKLEKRLDEDSKQILLKTTKTIEQHIEELRKLATDFYYFSKKPTPNFEKGSLLENILEVVSLYELAYPNIKFSIKAEDDGECIFDKSQFKRVWINLIDNSIKAMSGNGEITFALNREDSYVTVKMTDTGEGIKEEIKESIAKGDLMKLKDLGTGLIMVYSVIQLHRGILKIEKNYPQGASFIIKIPANISSLTLKT